MGKIILSFALFSSLYAVNIFETIFDGNCKSCHNLKDNDSAPFEDKIVKKYRQKYKNKEEFTRRVSSYVYNPNPNKTLFPNAIKHYGIMPSLNIDKETLKGIASYLYSVKFK